MHLLAELADRVALVALLVGVVELGEHFGERRVIVDEALEAGDLRDEVRHLGMVLGGRHQEEDRVEVALFGDDTVLAKEARENGGGNAEVGVLARRGVDARRGEQEFARVDEVLLRCIAFEVVPLVLGIEGEEPDVGRDLLRRIAVPGLAVDRGRNEGLDVVAAGEHFLARIDRDAHAVGPEAAAGFPLVHLRVDVERGEERIEGRGGRVHHEGVVEALVGAVALLALDVKVLLVDLNTRNPRLGSMFLHSVDYSRTLNALYKGETDPLEAVISLTGYLDLLPSVLERNAIPMDGQVFDFIRGLEKDYDYVIIDAPSVGQVSDVLSLNQIAQAVLFVIRYDDVALPMIQNAIDKLDKSGIRILGCVVNAAQKTGGKYFGGERNVVENRGRKPKNPEAETMKETMDDLNDLEDMMKSAKETQALKSTHPHTEEDTAFNGLLEELTDDLLETSNRLSNQEAIEALVQMGMNESGREESQEELENEDTEQSETDPEQSEQP